MPGTTRLRRMTERILCPAVSIEEIRVGMHRVRLDHDFLATRNMAYGCYEVNDIRWLQRLLRPGDRVLDVGGNVGYMAAHFARMVGRRGKVWSFEPSEMAFAYLEGVARSSACHVIEPIHSAVADRSGRGTFYETDAILSYGYGRLDRRPSSRFAVVEREVRVTTLDEFVAALGIAPVTLVKLDVEGHEAAALRGMRGLLASRNPPMVMTEVTNEGMYRDDLLAYAPALRSAGLQPHRALRRLVPLRIDSMRIGAHINVLWLGTQHLRRVL